VKRSYDEYGEFTAIMLLISPPRSWHLSALELNLVNYPPSWLSTYI